MTSLATALRAAGVPYRDGPVTIEDLTAPSPSSDASAPIVFARGAEVRLSGRTIWSGVDLDIAPGAFAAILGPNGVGKSTLIKAVLGQIPLAAGELRVLGQLPGRANHDIGYLPQRRAFDAGLRVRAVDLVRLGLDGDRWGTPLPRRFRRDRTGDGDVARLIHLVGAADYAGRPIGELSGGEQQRILIAQALVRRPRLLLLDEPLDSLDLPNQAAVSALVATICRDEQVAVMLVAHDVNPVLSYLDQVIYLGHGRAVSGSPDEVVTSATLTALYDAPVEVLQASDGRLVVVGQPEAPAHHADRHHHHA
jgi:zinc/manganese transport system ATP-binding protein